MRIPDIKIYKRNNEDWVSCKPAPRGISTFDKKVDLPGKWEFYLIPEGTDLPVGLAIVKNKFNEKFQATHYTIAPSHDMPLKIFRGLLNQLATQLRRRTG